MSVRKVLGQIMALLFFTLIVLVVLIASKVLSETLIPIVMGLFALFLILVVIAGILGAKARTEAWQAIALTFALAPETEAPKLSPKVPLTGRYGPHPVRLRTYVVRTDEWTGGRRHRRVHQYINITLASAGHQRDLLLRVTPVEAMDEVETYGEGDRIRAGDAEIDERFTLRTNDTEHAPLLLDDAVRDWLRWKEVRGLEVENGHVTVALKGFVEDPKAVRAWFERLQTVATRLDRLGDGPGTESDPDTTIS